MNNSNLDTQTTETSQTAVSPSPKESKSSSILTKLLLALVVVMGAGLAYLAWENNKQKLMIETLSANMDKTEVVEAIPSKTEIVEKARIIEKEISDWEISVGDGYSVQYPSDWFLNDESGIISDYDSSGERTRCLALGNADIGFGISTLGDMARKMRGIGNPSEVEFYNLSNGYWFSDGEYNNGGPGTIETKLVDVDGKQAIRETITWDPELNGECPGGRVDTRYYIYIPGETAQYFWIDQSYYTGQTSDKNTLDKIVDSIKLELEQLFNKF